MTTLEEISQQVEDLLREPLQLPALSEDVKRKTEATEELSSPYHNTLRRFKNRCWQAEKLGLQRMSLLQIAELLVGKKYKSISTWMGWDGKPGTWGRKDPPEHKFEYFYDDRIGSSSKNLTVESEVLFGQEPIFIKGGWLSGLPTLALSRVPNLKDEVPYPAILKIQQFKELKLFNCFSVVGPVQAYRSLAKPIPEPVDPVLVGCIYNLDYNSSSLDDPNYVAYYPLAKW